MNSLLSVESIGRTYRSGDQSPFEVTKYVLDRIESDDSSIGAFVEVRRKQTLDDAIASSERFRTGSPLGLLDGIPISVKANIATAGFRWSAGVRARSEIVATRDSRVVSLLRRAGALVIGTTNLPPGAIGAVTRNPWTGTTRNPRDLGRDAGGSSGGAAAAVVAGMGVLALGSDTLGSIRIPASLTGVTGFKPSRNGVNTRGLVPLAPELDTIGLLANCVQDILITLETITEQTTDSTEPLRPKRIGLVDTSSVQIGPDVQEAVHSAVLQMGSCGVEVEPVHMGFSFQEARLAGLVEVEIGAYIAHKHVFRLANSGFTPEVGKLLEYGSTIGPEQRNASQRIAQRVTENVLSAMDRFDALVTPTVPTIAPHIYEPEPSGLADLTAFGNIAGVPAISLPLTGTTLPIGIQLIGKRGLDEQLLRHGAFIERALNVI